MLDSVVGGACALASSSVFMSDGRMPGRVSAEAESRSRAQSNNSFLWLFGTCNVFVHSTIKSFLQAF